MADRSSSGGVSRELLSAELPPLLLLLLLLLLSLSLSLSLTLSVFLSLSLLLPVCLSVRDPMSLDAVVICAVSCAPMLLSPVGLELMYRLLAYDSDSRIDEDPGLGLSGEASCNDHYYMYTRGSLEGRDYSYSLHGLGTFGDLSVVICACCCVL